MPARKNDTLFFDRPPIVAAWAAAGGKKESEGPLAAEFDFLTQESGFVCARRTCLTRMCS